MDNTAVEEFEQSIEVYLKPLDSHIEWMKDPEYKNAYETEVAKMDCCLENPESCESCN